MGAFNKFLYGASGVSRGGPGGPAPPSPSPLIFRPNGPKKNFGDRALPLSQGLDPTLAAAPLRGTDVQPLTISYTRGTQRRFTPNCVENTFRLSRVLLHLYKYILTGAIKFIFVRSS